MVLQKVLTNMTNFERDPLISGKPPGWVLWPLSFVIHLNDLDSAISSDIIFVNDTKIGTLIKSDSDGIALQANLDMMNEWRDKW